jgi:hypothetical protein
MAMISLEAIVDQVFLLRVVEYMFPCIKSKYSKATVGVLLRAASIGFPLLVDKINDCDAEDNNYSMMCEYSHLLKWLCGLILDGINMLTTGTDMGLFRDDLQSTKNELQATKCELQSIRKELDLIRNGPNLHHLIDIDEETTDDDLLQIASEMQKKYD